MKILVVDDDPMAAEMIVAIVEDAGHETLMAENAVVALETIAKQPNIDLVISDNFMPLMNGPELCLELRGQNFKQPFILLSGDDYELSEDMKSNLSAYIIKDFTLADTLIETINRVISK